MVVTKTDKPVWRECLRCLARLGVAYGWWSKPGITPKACPNCKSRLWNEIRNKIGGPK